MIVLQCCFASFSQSETTEKNTKISKVYKHRKANTESLTCIWVTSVCFELLEFRTIIMTTLLLLKLIDFTHIKLGKENKNWQSLFAVRAGTGCAKSCRGWEKQSRCQRMLAEACGNLFGPRSRFHIVAKLYAYFLPLLSPNSANKDHLFIYCMQRAAHCPILYLCLHIWLNP